MILGIPYDAHFWRFSRTLAYSLGSNQSVSLEVLKHPSENHLVSKDSHEISLKISKNIVVISLICLYIQHIYSNPLILDWFLAVYPFYFLKNPAKNSWEFREWWELKWWSYDRTRNLTNVKKNYNEIQRQVQTSNHIDMDLMRWSCNPTILYPKVIHHKMTS